MIKPNKAEPASLERIEPRQGHASWGTWTFEFSSSCPVLMPGVMPGQYPDDTPEPSALSIYLLSNPFRWADRLKQEKYKRLYNAHPFSNTARKRERVLRNCDFIVLCCFVETKVLRFRLCSLLICPF